MIKNILESLREKVGKITLSEAAKRLYNAGWTNFIDIEATKRLLKL